MRLQDYIFQCHNARIDVGLLCVDVERQAADLSSLQRIDQRGRPAGAA
jgi:hypothetical protein